MISPNDQAPVISLYVGFEMKCFNVHRGLLWLFQPICRQQVREIVRLRNNSNSLIRPPVILCRRTYILPVFLFLLLLSFCFRPLISEVAERNSTKIGHMVGSKCNWKRMSEIGGIPSPTNRGPKTTFFGRLRNLTATLTVYIFGMKHDIENRLSALTTTRGLLHRPKMSWTLVYKRLKTRPAFLPTLRKLGILLHCQASQTEISKPNSTKLCQVIGSPKSP